MSRTVVFALLCLALLMPADARPAAIDPTGAADSTAGLQAAADAAARAGQPLHLCGRYKLSAPLRFHSDDGETGAGSGVIGCGETGAVLTLTDPTQDGIVIEAPAGKLYQSCEVRNVTIEAAPDRKTGGAGIHLVDTERCEIEHNRLIGMFVGLRLSSTALTHAAHNAFTETARGGVAIQLDGSDVNSYIVQNYADNPPAREPVVGLRITDNVNGTYVEDNSFSHFGTGLEVAPPPGGKVQNLFFRQNAWDLCRDSGGLFDASSGPIYRIFLVNEWFAATRAGPGLRFAGNAGLSNFQLVAPQVRDNWTNGIEIAGRVRQMVVATPVITANDTQVTPENHARSGTEDGAGVAVLAGADVADLQIRGGIIGPTAEEWKSQSRAVEIAAGAVMNRSAIIGVDVAGNTKGAIRNDGTGSGNVFTDNIGYNPVGAHVIAVGPSPFAYTAGPSPETLYLSGGTCGAITQGGVAIFAGCAAQTTIALGPNETVMLTYSVAPKMRAMVH